MRRRQLVEIEDLEWCPAAVRDGGTDWLRFMADLSGAFEPVAPKVRAAMEATGTTHVVDLCSGGGGPWGTLEAVLARSGPASVTLTDLYPNREALSFARERTDGRLAIHRDPVDATDVPAELEGVRTLFNSFHHFPPEHAREILADAVRKRRAICVFEGMHHRGVGVLSVLMQLPTILLLTPFIRPLRLWRLALTYVLPLIPAVILFDGTVSMLRLYRPEELEELVSTVPDHESFDWDIGTTVVPRMPTRIIHLVGVPRD